MTKKNSPMLSKSRFMAGLQCQLRLWHECYNMEFASEVSPVQQAVFDSGHEVGRLATQLYPGGVLIEEDHFHHAEAVECTRKAMKDPKVSAIYEAGFIYDGVRIRVDILERAGDRKWNLIEVKSATSAKEIYLPDVSIQYHVLKGLGLAVERVFLMHLNNRYVYDGQKLELEKLFSRTDLTQKADIYKNQVPSLLASYNDMLKQPEEPKIKPDKHCSIPYDCEFWEHCTRDMPEYWIITLTGISQKKMDVLEAEGFRDIRDIPASFSLSALQHRIRNCVITDRAFISPDLRNELKDMVYPIHFLDFETLFRAIPLYAGTRPYQSIPFQWSDHILSHDGCIEHREYLCLDDKDPRKEFIETLLDGLESKGTIVTYTNYEESMIKGLISHIPEHKVQLLSVLGRIKDLCKIIKSKYYHPKFYGSFSIKSVLPALLPEMSYKNLEIQDGQMAGLEYVRMMEPSTTIEEKEKIKRNLLTYCGHDTLAMLKIREKLLQQF